MNKPLAYFLYRLKYRYAPQLRLQKPVDVSLELSSFCNQFCSYCYHYASKNLPFDKGFMSFRTAEWIIADSASIKVPALKFNYRGESTMNPDFARIVNFAYEHAKDNTFIDRVLNSNFKFDSNKSEVFEAMCTLTKVKVSFDSFIPEVMHEQRGGSIHSLAMKNIDIFYNHPKRKNTKLVIQAVRTKLNKDEDIMGQAKARWPEALVSIRDMVAGRVEKDLTKLENKTRDFSNRQSCLQAAARLIFDHQGNAQVCCPDIKSELQIGNIKDLSIIQIWNHDKVKQLRKDLLSKKAFENSPCANCSSFESFKGYKHPWGS